MMKYFLNNYEVKLEDLRTIGTYDGTLLDELEEGRFEKLKELSEEQIEDPNFMEPILYAVYDKFKTYQVYKYFGEKLKDFLKSNFNLSREIMINEPELMLNSPMAENKKLILELSDENPEIVSYISPKLNNDREFIKELSDVKNADVVRAVIDKYSIETLLHVNKELSSNREFMAIAVQSDCSLLKYASSDILDDYDFFKEQSSKNFGVIEYSLYNNSQIGDNAAKAIADTTLEKITDLGTKVINDEANNKPQSGFAVAKERIEKFSKNSPERIRLSSGMLAISSELNCENAKLTLANAIFNMRTIQQKMKDKNFEPDLDKSGIISPFALSIMINKLPELQNDEKIMSAFLEYKKDFGEVQARRKKIKDKKLEIEKKLENGELKAENKNISDEKDFHVFNDKLRDKIRNCSPEEFEKKAKEAALMWESKNKEKEYKRSKSFEISK